MYAINPSENKYFYSDIPKYVKEIKDYRNIPQGWYQGEGKPADAFTIERALNIADYAYNNFLGINSAIGVDGNILLAFFFRGKSIDKYIEINIESFNYKIMTFERFASKWKITKTNSVNNLLDVRKSIDSFSRESHICQLSQEFFLKDGSIGTSTPSQAKLSKNLEKEFQSYIFLVSKTPEIQYVNI